MKLILNSETEGDFFSQAPLGSLTSYIFQTWICAHLIQIQPWQKAQPPKEHFVSSSAFTCEVLWQSGLWSTSTDVKYKGPPNLFECTGIPNILRVWQNAFSKCHEMAVGALRSHKWLHSSQAVLRIAMLVSLFSYTVKYI